MGKGIRIFVAFILNFFFDGVGFIFSGFVHKHWTLLGGGIGVTVLFATISIREGGAFPFLTTSTIVLSLLVAGLFGALGVLAENQLSKTSDGLTKKQDYVLQQPPPLTVVGEARAQVLTSPKSQKESFFCRYCGAENESDAIFCEICGRQIA